jgi:hypothetical protein
MGPFSVKRAGAPDRSSRARSYRTESGDSVYNKTFDLEMLGA